MSIYPRYLTGTCAEIYPRWMSSKFTVLIKPVIEARRTSSGGGSGDTPAAKRLALKKQRLHKEDNEVLEFIITFVLDRSN